jgi:transposase
MKSFQNTEKFVEGKEVFCGIDVHLNNWSICFYCDGEVVEKHRLFPKYENLLHLLKSHFGTARAMSIVYEAGFSGFWLYRRLTADGYRCMVTPPNRIPRQGDRVKTDRRDAEKLARFLAAGLLKNVIVPSPETESHRRLLRRRSRLVRKQTQIKNQIKSFLNLYGFEKPDSIRSPWSKAYMEWLQNLRFEQESDSFILSGMLRNCRQIREELAELTRYIRRLAYGNQYYDSFNRLTALRGVGLVTAMTFLLELFDISRFGNTAKFSSYLGMSPSQHSSGDQVHMGAISRQGNSHLRYVLVESAWTVIRHDPSLREKYNRIRARGTNGNKAIVAVARSLAIRLRRCLLDGVEYNTSVA